MSITVDCPNGHTLKVKSKYAGKAGRCPHCRARVHVPDPAAVSDDVILGFLGGPRAAAPDLPEGNSVLDDPPVRDPDGTGISLMGSSLVREKKICPNCGKMVSRSFRYCPSCSTNLTQPFSNGAEPNDDEV